MRTWSSRSTSSACSRCWAGPEALLALLASLPAWAEIRPGIGVIAAVLAGLGVATIGVTRMKGPVGTGSLRAQITSWWWLWPPVFIAWASRTPGVTVLVGLLSLLAVLDLARHAARPASALAEPGLKLALVAQAALLSIGRPAAAVAAMAILALSMALAWRAGPAEAPWRRDALLLALFGAQAAGLGCLAWLVAPGIPRAADWFLYLCVVTAHNDIAQYVVGTALGRHKLSRRISPNKTWQGFAGGLAAGVAFSLAAGGMLGLAGAPWLVAMGLAVSAAGLAGDLLFSVGKRTLGIKDYSALIPGHGGILDRVDSLVLTAPALLLALHFT